MPTLSGHLGSLARFSLASGALLLAAPLVSGCELFVHFDRSRIGADTGATIDTGVGEGGVDAGHDTGVDANHQDVGPVDMGPPTDTGPVDMGHMDMGGMDMGTDTGPVDMGTDVWRPDTGVDAGCQVPAVDCPATTTACVIAICVGGGCSTMNASMGQSCSDSGGTVCDGSGHCVACNTANDCAPASCTGTMFTPAATCNASHTCVPGTPVACSGGTPICDVAAGCVQCNSGGDCPAASCTGTTFTAASTCNGSHMCVAGTMTSCMGATPICNASAGCVQCNGAGDCAAASCSGAMFTAAATCNGSHACVAGSTTDCSTMATMPVCNAASGCVACNASADCTVPTTPICNTTAHTCGGCTGNPDCVGIGRTTCNGDGSCS